MFEYSSSSYEPIVNELQGVKIVDPNPNGQIIPHEDLFIYISLIAKQRSKSVITKTTDEFYRIETQYKNAIDLITPQQAVVIDNANLFKSKPTLTTAWTEIGGHNASTDLGKDYEGFGITNIDVKIVSQSAPQVTIDFIDVRGATLFEQGSCSPYALFFTLPYPIFSLTLKGYYGRPIEYYLNLVKFNSKFNSETGNMECRAEFIGYSFAFLSDVIMGYVKASQRLKESPWNPQRYLREAYVKSVKEDGHPERISYFCDSEKTGPKRCYTIFDLMRKVEEFDTQVVPDIGSSPEYKELENLNALNRRINAYDGDVNKLITELEAKKGAAKKSNANSVRDCRFEFSDNDLVANSEIVNLINQYFKKGSQLPSDIEVAKDTIISNSQKGSDYVDLSTTAKSGYNDANYGKLYDKIAGNPWNNIFNGNVATLSEVQITKPTVDTTNGGVKFIDFGWILLDIEAEKQKLIGDGVNDDGTLTKKRRTVIEKINNVVRTTFGFDPTIRNIFTIILCNTEAFMDILKYVAEEAEKQHNSRADEYKSQSYLKPSGNGAGIGISPNGKKSGEEKVFPWPTYFVDKFVKKGQKQGRKEDYPGNNAKFANWVEVRFVEDFIEALIDSQKEDKILRGETKGEPGYDNYVPINPLESPYWSGKKPFKYLDVSNPQEIKKIIGERLFIALDHSSFAPIRLTNDACTIPQIGNNGKWTTLSSNASDANSNISGSFGEIEAWNILNVYKNDTQILNALSTSLNPTNLDPLIKEIKGLLVGLTEVDASALENVDKDIFPEMISDRSDGVPTHLGYDPAEKYYVYNPPDGIILSKAGDPAVAIKPNPFDMPADKLIRIEEEQSKIDENKIELTEDKNKTAVENFTKSVSDLVNKVTFGNKSYNPEDNNAVTLSDSQKVITWENDRLWTTLAAFNKKDEDGANTWWSSKSIANSQDAPYLMASLMYWDYEYNNEGYGLTLFPGTGISKTPKIVGSDLKLAKDKTLIEPEWDFDFDEGMDEDAGTGGDNFATSFVTTPMWLDNVVKFRETPLKVPNNFFLNGTETKIYSGEESTTGPESLERRNLAYLFLHTLKMTPFVIRYISEGGEMRGRLAALNNQDIGGGYPSSLIWGLKAFNTIAGEIKLPKAWVLAFGAQLWRWKMFVGTKPDGSWNKPLSCIGCDQGDAPTGFDPIAQPGYNYNGEGNVNWNDPTVGEIYDKIIKFCKRNNIEEYMKEVYQLTTFSVKDSIQTSSFVSQNFSTNPSGTNNGAGSTDTGPTDQGEDGLKSDKLPSFSTFVYFPYYNYINDKIGLQIFSDKMVNLFPKQTSADIRGVSGTVKYSYPALWLAPHHIPYVHPERFSPSGGDKLGEGTVFTQLFAQNFPSIDYITIMPDRREKMTISQAVCDKTGTVMGQEDTTRTVGFQIDGTNIIGPGKGYLWACGQTDVLRQNWNIRRNPTYFENLTVNPDTTEGYGLRGDGMGRSRQLDGNLGSIIQNIPDGVKDIFVKYFDEWAGGTEWENFLTIIDPVHFGTGGNLSSTYFFRGGKEDDNLGVNYLGNDAEDSATLVMDASTDLVKNMFSKLMGKISIFNSTPKIWYGIEGGKNPTVTAGQPIEKASFTNQGFVVSEKNFRRYLEILVSKFDDEKTEIIKKADEEKAKNNEVSVGGPLEDDDLKLALYRTFKSLTEKWISSTPEGKSFFNVTSCGPGLSDKGSRTSLASHFQYVNRVMADIGDISMISVDKIRDLKKNTKISLYNFISDILTDNEYMFFPLPGYIDFTNQGLKKEDLKDMFRPILTLKRSSCGPTFMCMYVGGNSKQLKYKVPANCPADLADLLQLQDDSFWVSEMESNQDKVNTGGAGLPDEITSPLETSPTKTTGGYTAFKVVYGQQNQNYFTNIQLDQSEFSETAESLAVIDKLSQQGEGGTTSKGQNLNTVYLTRSYTCQVESLGNMMIQPMTYFDLIGVPLFNGAYLITEVNHNFKPNHATTNFKGVRQPRATVPIVTDAAIAMKLTFNKDKKGSGKSLDEIGGNNSGAGGGRAGLGQYSIYYKEIPTEITSLFGPPMACAKKPDVSSPFGDRNNRLHEGYDITPTVGFDAYTSSDPRIHNSTGRGYKDRPGKVEVISAYNGIVVYTGTRSGFGTPSTGNFLDSTYSGTMGGVIVVKYGQPDPADASKVIPFSDGNYYYYNYGHCEATVNVGDKVTKGQVIGHAVWPNFFDNGGTIEELPGTGLHLHLEIYQNPTDTYSNDNKYLIVPAPFINSSSDAQDNCITNAPVYGVGDDAVSLSSEGNTPVIRFLNSIMAGESDTFYDYNYFLNTSSSLPNYSVFHNRDGSIKVGRQYGGFTRSTKITDYSIGEILDFWRKPKMGEPGKLFATGRYQITSANADTIEEYLTNNGIATNTLYDENLQNVLGELLLFRRSPIKKYVQDLSYPDTKANLEEAALSLAQLWASIGVPYAVNGKNKNESYYSQRIGCNTETAQEALKRLRAEWNGQSYTPPGSNNGNSNNSSANASETLIIGDSQSPSVKSGLDAAGVSSKVGTGSIEYKDGWSVGSLVAALGAVVNGTTGTFPKNTIKNVVISLGTNGAFNKTGDGPKITQLGDLLAKAYPNATKILLVKGSWCWGTNTGAAVGNCTTSTCQKVEDYYTNMKTLLQAKLAGKTIEIIPTPIGCVLHGSHPAYAANKDKGTFDTIGTEIKAKI